MKSVSSDRAGGLLFWPCASARWCGKADGRPPPADSFGKVSFAEKNAPGAFFAAADSLGEVSFVRRIGPCGNYQRAVEAVYGCSLEMALAARGLKRYLKGSLKWRSTGASASGI